MGFNVIGAGQCYLHHQHAIICYGRINIGEHFMLSCTAATHHLQFRANNFQLPPHCQAVKLAAIVNGTHQTL